MSGRVSSCQRQEFGTSGGRFDRSEGKSRSVIKFLHMPHKWVGEGAAVENSRGGERGYDHDFILLLLLLLLLLLSNLSRRRGGDSLLNRFVCPCLDGGLLFV